MKTHCGWCGKWVAKNTEPILGFNAYGRRVAQTLCSECGYQWSVLAATNEERLNNSDFARGLRKNIAQEIEAEMETFGVWVNGVLQETPAHRALVRAASIALGGG